MKLSQNNLSSSDIIKLIRQKKSDFWSLQQKKRALFLFDKTAKEVPAYKDFLKKNNINPERIKTWQDFQQIPFITKKNYLRVYPIEKLCWQGTIKNKPIVFAATSGSTGEPFYFPRGQRLDWEYSVMAEMFLQNSSYQSKGPTLVIIGFGMGVWIGGIITYKAFEIASQRLDHPVSIITPGINKQEIFNALEKLAPHYKETILIAYPPFLKDLIDEAIDRGINLKKLNIRFLTAAEAYNEKFRDYIVKKSSVRNHCLDTLNVYGTADIGAMAWETPTSILIRRLAMKDKKLFYDIFTNINKTPTLAQYNPLFIAFESVDGEILLTGNNTIPLVRYALGDHGGAMTFEELKDKLRDNGINLFKEAKWAGIGKNIYELPFVYVYERSDFSVVLCGANIYPEEVREGLQDKSLEKYITTKCTMLIKHDRRFNEYLEINIELLTKIKKTSKLIKKLEPLAQKKIIETLLRRNSEYVSNYQAYQGNERVIPKLVFWPYGHPLYFKSGIKQKWVKK